MSSLNFENLRKYRWPHWSSTTNFDLIDGGRMALMWDTSYVDLNVIEVDKQHIHCECVCKVTQLSFVITFVYALYTVLERRSLWEYIANLGSNIDRPWLVMGDFNCVSSPNERVGPIPPSAYLIQDLVDFKINTSLVDTPSTGEFFTWNRGSLWAKLDRVLMNSTWSSIGIACKTHFHALEVEFDHVAPLVTFGFNPNMGSKPFKFFNMWLKHDSFPTILHEHWFKFVCGNAQFRLVKKLQSLKKPLKELNNVEFGHISSKVKESKLEFKRLHNLLLHSPLDDTIKNELQLAKKRVLFLKKAEDAFFKQKAKATHLFQGDRCTKYFHSLVKKKAARNSITALKLPNGELTTSIEQVANELEIFYVNLFGTPVSCPPIDSCIIQSGICLDIGQTSGLIAPILDIEIKNAIFDIGDDKAPGPDGFTSAFFKENWAVVGDDVIEAVNGFFDSGRLLKQINHTIIALIPKTSHSPMASDFRPIACTNVIYKVITKIIANRMIPCLSGLIDHAQGAFVNGRLMMDNIFLAQELVKGYTRKHCSPRCMIKVDLRKAYDTISWDFLKSVLLNIGFPLKFVNWIMECVSTPSFSISLNGTLHGFFRGKRGLRQGDPMSPLLFVLCLEYLSRLLNMRTMSGFNFHPKCGSLKISHLAYADDLMLFCRGDTYSIKILIDALNDFGDVSGLRVNFEKSNIFLGGVKDNELSAILDLVDFKVGAFPVKYLGIPLSPLKLSVVEYAPLLEKISNYLNSWNTKSLSYAGRTELIKSVIQGVHSFWLQVFPIPQAILDRVTSLCRVFFWGCKFARVAWADMCLPKEEGGLGIRHTKTWNNALLSKTLWDIHLKRDTLWVKWVHGVYLKGRCVWDFSPHTRDSQLMKKIGQIRDLLISKYESIGSTIDGLAKLSQNGKLCSSKVYDLIRTKGTKHVWMAFIWKAYIPPKFSFIAWLAFRNRLATYDNLSRLELINLCPFCKGEPETVSHLFFECQFTGTIWNKVRAWIGMPRLMTTLDSSVKWTKKDYGGAGIKAKTVRIAFIYTIYWIWRVRNATRFDAAKDCVEEVFARIQYMVYKILYSIYPHELIMF